MRTFPDLNSRDIRVDTATFNDLTRNISPIEELRRLGVLARHGWTRGARPWLGVAIASATALVSILLHFHVFTPELWRSGDVNASLPLTSELARLPMSLLFPTPYLPLWAACGQLLIVFGLGELILGRWLTVMVAIAGHFGSTLVASVLLTTVHGNVFGLTPALAHALDTGPSAATTAVGACLLVAARMNRCAMLLGLVLFAAAVIAPGVDGVEHVVALVCGLIAGVACLLVASKSTRISTTSSEKLWPSRVARITRVFRSPRSATAAMRDRS